MDIITFRDDGILISLKVIPNSSKNELIKADNSLRLKITAPPIDNKANKFVIEFFSKKLKVPKTSIKIIRGETSREKTIFLSLTNQDKRNFIKDFFYSI